MRYEPIARPDGAFQQPVGPGEIRAVVRAAFGATTEVASAVELGGGYYNSTFLLDVGEARPIILRVAPDPTRQSRADPELMRNEYASVPYLAPIAQLLPRTLAVDFTHQVIGRDVLFQTKLDGIPATTAMRSLTPSQRGEYFQQLGDITGVLHTVSGHRFGPVAGPTSETWSDALFSWFERAAADLSAAGVDAALATDVVVAADRNRAVIDAITVPRLLHGDLWVGNTLLDGRGGAPTIVGVLDCDRTWWGDPAADWPLYLAARKRGGERDRFWAGYGAQEPSEDARWRALVYEAKHAIGLLIELRRAGDREEAAATIAEIRDLTARLCGGRTVPQRRL